MPKVRSGKTARDRKTNVQAKRRNNQVARHTWINENRGVGSTLKTQFPTHTLGGKGNSSKAFKMVRGQRTQQYQQVAKG